MKQTAVEFLIEQLKGKSNYITWNEIFEQAIEMEKKQIIDAYRISTIESSVPKEFKKYNSAEQYYKEKFNK